MDKLNVTIIGAGHYAKDLIYPKYKEHPGWNVKATISPNSSIPGVPAFKSVAQWEDCYGMAKPDDVFDLCIFPDILTATICAIAAIDGKKIILPKPIAEDEESLGQVLYAIAENKMDAVVASQWAYDMELRRKLAGDKNVHFVFSQRFKNKQQNLVNAFLPHVVQLCNHTQGNVKVDFRRGIEKVRTVRINKGRNIDLSKRGDCLKCMVDDFYLHFYEGRYCGLNFKDYYPIALSYLQYKALNNL